MLISNGYHEACFTVVVVVVVVSLTTFFDFFVILLLLSTVTFLKLSQQCSCANVCLCVHMWGRLYLYVCA